MPIREINDSKDRFPVPVLPPRKPPLSSRASRLGQLSALTTWYGGLRKCPQAGRAHHRSSRGTGPWAHSPLFHPGRALGGRSSLRDRLHCILHPGGRGSGRSGCKNSHTAGTPGPVGSPELEMGDGGRCQVWYQTLQL